MLDEETIKTVSAQVEMLYQASIKSAPTVAKAYRAYYDEYMKAGFTEEQTMRLLVAYKPST